MNRLVSYAVTSSDDDEDAGFNVSQEYAPAMFERKLCRKKDCVETISSHRLVNVCTSHNQGELDRDAQIQDLPITDESDGQNADFINSDNENCDGLSCSTKVTDLTLVSFARQLKSETIQPQDCSWSDSQIVVETGDVQEKVTDHLIPAHHQSNIYPQTTSLGNLQVQTSHISVPRDGSKSANDTDSVLSPSLEENQSLTGSSPESISLLQPVRPETVSCTLPNRKRKLNDGSDKHLALPDSIQSMYPNKPHRWMDDPTQHDHRVRSFPHLEGNWATHVYIPVAKTEPFVKFVDQLLGWLMPPVFQVQPDFHVSLSRTVTIRYHWIDLLVDSLREQFKSLTSCISDLTSVKLFTNDDKTRTFVVIELSQEDIREFMTYVKSVDKSFAEFKLPAYYENPSFHISVGWCLGDATGHVPGEKLSKAQEMLGEFVAAHSDLSFVYVRQICCQTGCKSFVITLPDSNS